MLGQSISKAEPLIMMVYPVYSKYVEQKTSSRSSKLDLIFETFKRIAFDWRLEGIGRLYYWCYEPKTFVTKIEFYPDALDTYCIATVEILLTMLFPLYSDPLLLFRETTPFKEFSLKAPFSKTFASIFFMNNVCMLKNQTDFICHVFTLEWEDSGHIFLALQYLNVAGKPSFRIYQSFLDHYGLSEFLEKNDKEFTLDQFLNVMTDLSYMFQNGFYDQRFLQICRTRFMGNTNLTLGNLNSTKMTLYYKTGSLSTFEKILIQFNTIRSSLPAFRPTSLRRELTIFNQIPPIIAGFD